MTNEVEPQSIWIESHGLRLHAVDWGNPELPALLLLHGLQDCARNWDGFAAAVRDRYHVIALDHRGHGDSPWADTYHLEDYVAELAGVIEALDLRDLTLMGHSAGGKNSFIYASRHPERLRRLLIVEMDPDAVNPGSATMFVRYKSESDDYPDLAAVVERIRSRQPRSSEAILEHDAVHLTKPNASGGLTWKRDRNLVLKYERPDAWEYLPKIAVPTLIVRGADSPLLTGPVAARMHEQIPGSLLVEIPDAGHWVHLEQPDRFREAVSRFL
ncbi:MAG: alpha/beta fold hydrolase [Dehalococcoidia bacterium]